MKILLAMPIQIFLYAGSWPHKQLAKIEENAAIYMKDSMWKVTNKMEKRDTPFVAILYKRRMKMPFCFG